MASSRRRAPVVKGLRASWIAGFGLLLLGGCVTSAPEEPPDVLLQRLRAGEPVLQCGLPCREAWRANRATALLFNESRRWPDLAVLVMRIGYMDDLTYYYLGRAAEGLGYTGAAMTYYKISERLTASGLTCNTEGANFCNGQFFPAAAQVRLVELTAPPPPPGRLPKTHTAQQRHRPPSRQAKSPAPAPAQNTAPATTSTAVAPEPTDEPTSPDFAAPPPIRR